MKIVILIPLFPPKWMAGTELATYQIAMHLAERGHEVHVITSLDSGTHLEEHENGFVIHRVKRINFPVLDTLSYSRGALRNIKVIRPDIVHAQFVFMGFHAWWSQIRFKIPYLVYARGSDVYGKWPMKRLLSRTILKHASSVVVLTSDMKLELARFYSREITVIPNGIGPEKILHISKAAARASLSLDNDSDLVLFVGSLREVKGVKYLVQAMTSVLETRKNARLLIVGDGPDRHMLEELASKLGVDKHVIFLGKKSNEDVMNYMAASDVFVLPSLSEGFPNVILEAMAVGLPVVCTDVGGIREIITDGSNGYIVKAANPEALGERIIQLLADPYHMRRIGEANRELAGKYGWNKVIDRLEEVYGQISNARN